MDGTEYTRLRRQLEEEFSRDLEALDRVWRFANPNSAPPIPAAQADNSRPRSGRGEITGAVREVLHSISGPFTWKTIRDRLAATRPDLPANRTTISQVLRKLTELKEVDELEAGRGKRPAYYGFSEPEQVQEPVEDSHAFGPATFEQVEKLKSLCNESGLSVGEFRAKYIVGNGYQRASEMPQIVIAGLIEDVEHDNRTRREAEDSLKT